LPECFYHQLRLALYEITWSANFVLGDMKVESSVLINREYGHIKILDYGVGDEVGNFPKEVTLNMAHNGFLNFLSLMNSYQLFRNLPLAEKDFLEALKSQENSGSVEYFSYTNCRDIQIVLEQREELKLGEDQERKTDS
jgi:hypothetical protein